jgi:hypothetical protein
VAWRPFPSLPAMDCGRFVRIGIVAAAAIRRSRVCCAARPDAGAGGRYDRDPPKVRAPRGCILGRVADLRHAPESMQAHPVRAPVLLTSTQSRSRHAIACTAATRA